MYIIPCYSGLGSKIPKFKARIQKFQKRNSEAINPEEPKDPKRQRKHNTISQSYFLKIFRS